MNTIKSKLLENFTTIKKVTLVFLLLFSFVFGGFVTPQASNAGLLESQEGFGEDNDIGGAFGQAAAEEPDDPRVFVAKVINIFLEFLGILLLIIIVYAGFLWMTAGGNEENVKQAKQYMSRAVIGLSIVLLAWAITNFLMDKVFSELIQES